MTAKRFPDEELITASESNPSFVWPIFLSCLVYEIAALTEVDGDL